VKTLLLSLLLASGVAAQTRDHVAEYAKRLGSTTFAETWTAASELRLEDGADGYEAYVLSAAYLYAHIDLCSSIRTLRDDGQRWIAETTIGEPPGDPGPPVLVEKATGATSSPNNKIVTDPKTYLELVRR
jgi:hypothetical protein